MSWADATSMMSWRKDFLNTAPVGLFGLLMMISLVLDLMRVLRSSIEGSQLFSGLACQRSTVAPRCLGTSYSDWSVTYQSTDGSK